MAAIGEIAVATVFLESVMVDVACCVDRTLDRDALYPHTSRIRKAVTRAMAALPPDANDVVPLSRASAVEAGRLLEERGKWVHAAVGFDVAEIPFRPTPPYTRSHRRSGTDARFDLKEAGDVLRRIETCSEEGMTIADLIASRYPSGVVTKP